MDSVKEQITVLEFTHTVGQEPSKFNAESQKTASKEDHLYKKMAWQLSEIFL